MDAAGAGLKRRTTGADVDAKDDLPTVQCWACSTHLRFSGTVPMVQCALCGAYIAGDNGVAGRRKQNASLLVRIASTPPCLFASAAVLSCIGVGTLFSLPWYLERIQAAWWLQAVLWVAAITVSFNTAFNFFACMFGAVGVTSKDVWTPVPKSEVWTGMYDKCEFCYRCNLPKPPGYHHCKMCGVCVSKMDHHCVFTGRCVGLRNHRHFILFLCWLLAAVAFMLTLCCFAFSVVRLETGDMRDAMLRRQGPSAGGPFIASLGAIVHSGDGLHIAALAYLSVCSVAVLIGVSILLGTQVHNLNSGDTTLDHIARSSGRGREQPEAGSAEEGRALVGSAHSAHTGRWRELFGDGPVWKWPLPLPLPPIPSPVAARRHEEVPQVHAPLCGTSATLLPPSPETGDA